MADDATPERGSSPQDPPSPLQDILAENPVQVDDAIPDHDSVLDESEGETSSQLTSLKSSIVNYKYENGRRYHAFREGTYPVPNDEQEQDRMDMVHHIFSLLLGGKLYLAPIGDNVQRVLDLGTGTGIWAMDFADEHPGAEVLGIDLSPIQPVWTPPNCIFEVDDFESNWLYRQPFDYIHARELEGCIANPDRLFRQALEHLAPGGYLEMQAVDGFFESDDGTAELAVHAQAWIRSMLDGARQFGKPLDTCSEWKEQMEAAGFVDVQQEVFKFPIGPWPKDPKLKEIGTWQYWQELQVVESYTHGIYSRVLGWDNIEIEVFKAKVKNDFRNPAIHIYLPVVFVWGRKP
ncbi:hypothetical protein AUP68_15216 [Ilyonectria robusta]